MLAKNQIERVIPFFAFLSESGCLTNDPALTVSAQVGKLDPNHKGISMQSMFWAVELLAKVLFFLVGAGFLVLAVLFFHRPVSNT